MIHAAAWLLRFTTRLSNRPLILVITSKQDGHVGAVSRHFDDHAVPWVRLNTDDFATNVRVRLSPSEGLGHLDVLDSGRTIDLREVHAVWFRKPAPVSVSHFAMDRPALDYVEGELNEILFGIYALLRHAHWINDPFSTRVAHRKLLQLKVANDVGFATPRTLITNDPEDALEFSAKVGHNVAIKALSAISVTERVHGSVLHYGVFTRRVTSSDLNRVKDKFRHMPTLLQEFVEKQYELRITCVGSEVFACRIESRADELPADDYRFDTANTKHSIDDCEALHGRLHAYMAEFGLNFGCFDVLVPKTGVPVFLECNPNGQWLWVEDMTGLPISKAIAQNLMSADRSRRAPRAFT